VLRNSLEDAIKFIEQGKQIKAQKVLKPLIAANHHDLAAWFWFVETCSTKEQRISVLEICLEYNPDNEQVKQALDRLRSAPPQNLSVWASIYPALSSRSESTEIGIPDNIKVSKDFQHLHIAIKWFGFKFIVLTLIAVVWDTSLINWYSMGSSPFYPCILFPFFHIAVGVGLTYYTLAGYLNKTYIDVDFNSITVQYKPLPLWGNKKVSTQTIEQLHYEWDDFWGIPNNRSGYHFYAVSATTKERRVTKLVRGLDNSEQALFIKQEIEKFLNIDEFAHLR
jgi:hypothetical protein